MNLPLLSDDKMEMKYLGIDYVYHYKLDDSDECVKCDLKVYCCKTDGSRLKLKDAFCAEYNREDNQRGYWKSGRIERQAKDNRSDEERIIAQMILG